MDLIGLAIIKSFQLWFHSRYLKKPNKKPNHPGRCAICQEQLYDRKLMACYQFRIQTRRSKKNQKLSKDEVFLDHKNQCQKCEKFFDKKQKKASTN